MGTRISEAGPLTRPARALGHQAGFTMLELAIVVLLIGILSMLAVPTLTRSVEQATLEEMTISLLSALEYARMATVTTGRTHRVTFDPALDTITVEEQQNAGLAALQAATGTTAAANVEQAKSFQTALHPVTRAPYVLALAQRWGTRAGIASAALGGDTAVVFSPPGQPDSGGTVVVQLGGITRTITVNAVSGFAHV